MFLHDMLYASGILWNLMFILCLVLVKYVLTSDASDVYLCKNNFVIAPGYIYSGLYVLDIMSLYSNDYGFTYIIASRNECDDMVMWHARMRHIGQEMFNQLAKSGLLNFMTKFELPGCNC